MIGYQNGQVMLELESLWWRDQIIAGAFERGDPKPFVFAHIRKWIVRNIGFRCLREPPWILLTMCEGFERKDHV